MYLTPAPTRGELLDRLGREELNAALAIRLASVDRGYLHWHDLKRKRPPGGLTAEQWWLREKLGRESAWLELPLRDRNGEALGFTSSKLLEKPLHRIDRRCAGTGGGAGLPSWHASRERFLVDSWIEEAIRSSQIEGATTSQEAAKDLLLSGRKPRDRSERMIVDNYEGIRFMREEMGPTLTPEKVLELHRVLTARTLDEADAGRLQHPAEERVAVRDHAWEVLHRPPPAEQLPERLERLCAFANAGEEEEPFVHPVLRAVLLHFWLAYDHPFVDGNGRTARVLFYWAMRQRGYWFAEYLPISAPIRDARGQYERAFLETETDGGDTTYFLLNQLGVIERAIERFDRYVDHKSFEQREVKALLHEVSGINGRQSVLLTHALKHPDHAYTFGGHAHSNGVTHETARADLTGLVELGLLTRRRQGRSYVFEPAVDLPRRLKESTA